MIDPNQPAFPEIHIFHWQGKEADGQKTDNVIPRWMGGLTKREYFAAMAMQGQISTGGTLADPSEKGIAKFAAKYADSLIAELNKEPK